MFIAQELATRLPNHSIPVERTLLPARVVTDGWTSPHGTLYTHSVPLPTNSRRPVFLHLSSFVLRTPVWSSAVVLEDGDDAEIPL